jgi:hypothetical protein
MFGNVTPGSHKVTVILGLADHRAVQPPVAPSVSFTVGAQAVAPAQLPKTGDGSTASAPLPIAGIADIALLAVAVLGAARLGLGHRR